MTPLTIYLWQQADQLKSFISASGYGLLFAVFYYCVFTQKTGVVSMFSSWSRTSMVLASSLLLLAGVLFPTSKTIAMMVAIPAIANSEPIQKDLPELYQLAKEALKEQITGGKK